MLKILFYQQNPILYILQYNSCYQYNRNTVHMLMESMQTVQCAVLTLIGNALRNIFQDIELYMTKKRASYRFNGCCDFSRTNFWSILISNHFIYLFDFPLSNATIERTLTAQQISFYFIFSVYVQCLFGKSGNISSTAMKQFQKQQNILLAYDKIYAKICIPNGWIHVSATLKSYKYTKHE